MQRYLIGSLPVMKQNSPRPKKARMSRSQVKATLVCFFDHKRIVHYEFIAQGQTVNQQRYLEVITSLPESVWRKRSGLWLDKMILHHDNALCMMRSDFASSWLRNPLQKWTILLIRLIYPPAIFGSFQN
jgi:hypothetical protein